MHGTWHSWIRYGSAAEGAELRSRLELLAAMGTEHMGSEDIILTQTFTLFGIRKDKPRSSPTAVGRLEVTARGIGL